MANRESASSIFSQKLDRIVFTSFFLGAVVPLLALAFVVQNVVLPTVTDRLVWMGLVGLVLSIASLSLGSFLVVRRTTLRTVDRIAKDNRRLAALLKASGAFANATHQSEAAATTVRCAIELAEADAVFAFARGSDGKPAELLQSLGADAEELLKTHRESIARLRDLAIEEGRVVLQGNEDGSKRGTLVAAAVPLSGEDEAMGALVAVQTRSADPFDTRRVDALTTLASLASVSLRNSDLRDAQRNFFAHMTELVVTALDAHLRQQRGHGDRVAQYANRVGRSLGLAERELETLHFSALLHDIGMLRIDRPLLETEKAFVQHPRIGARMLERIRLWKDLAPVVLHHHERFDGTGYPEGLRGEAIPRAARIIAVCEAFDVMVSQATYKDTKSVPEAILELETCAGSQFDPDIVCTFLDLVEQGVIEPPRS